MRETKGDSAKANSDDIRDIHLSIDSYTRSGIFQQNSFFFGKSWFIKTKAKTCHGKICTNFNRKVFIRSGWGLWSKKWGRDCNRVANSLMRRSLHWKAEGVGSKPHLIQTRDLNLGSPHFKWDLKLWAIHYSGVKKTSGRSWVCLNAE